MLFEQLTVYTAKSHKYLALSTSTSFPDPDPHRNGSVYIKTKKIWKKYNFCILSHWRFWNESGSVSQRYGSEDPDPDPYQNVTDPEHWPTTPLLWVTWRYRWSAGSSLRKSEPLPRSCRHHFPGIRHLPCKCTSLSRYSSLARYVYFTF